MAIEIKTTNLAELRAMAETLLEKLEEEKDVEKRRGIEKDIDEVVKFYTATSKALCYKTAKETGDPMKYAITEFFFPSIKFDEKEDSETDTIIRSIVDIVKPIDLGDMHKKLEGIGANKNWIHTAEKLNYHLSIRAAERVGATLKKDSYNMSKIARDIELGKNPCSNTQLLKTLNIVISEMLGEEFKATSHDVNYLVDVYANDSKKSKTGITAANHKTLRSYLKKVCYRILTDGKGYTVETREIKEDK